MSWRQDTVTQCAEMVSVRDRLFFRQYDLRSQNYRPSKRNHARNATWWL